MHLLSLLIPSGLLTGSHHVGIFRVVRASCGGKLETKNPLCYRTVFPPPAVRSSQHGSVSCKKINSTFVYDLTAALCMYISVLSMGDDLGMAVSTSK